MAWSVHNPAGQRKYLTAAETGAFLAAASKRDEPVYGFCLLLAATGCRISEALALGATHFDFEAEVVIIESLKKRRRAVYRAVPLPPHLLALFQRWLKAGVLAPERFWPWSRMTGYRRVCEVMREARINGGHASPKGLRHGFGVSAIQAGVPLNLVQRWLGHADIKTTSIYTHVTGAEERALASRMWKHAAAASRRESAPPPPEAHESHQRIAALQTVPPAQRLRLLHEEVQMICELLLPVLETMLAKEPAAAQPQGAT
jgi:integrase